MKSHWYVVGSVANFLTLLVGIAIGFSLSSWHIAGGKVLAQAALQPSQEIEEISPTITFGSAATALLLAHEVAADRVIVNGIDLLKLHENTLNYLASQPLANRAQIERIAAEARATKVYRLKPPPSAAPSQKGKEEKKQP
jgi:hypothetical protein